MSNLLKQINFWKFCLLAFSFFVFCFGFFLVPTITKAGQITLPPNNLGLVGYWSFEDATGTVATDFSGNGNVGALTNGPLWSAGKAGKAIDLDGTDDYVSLGSNLLNGEAAITVAAWVNMNALPGHEGTYYILAADDGSSSGSESVFSMGVATYTSINYISQNFLGVNAFFGVRTTSGPNGERPIAISDASYGGEYLNGMAIVNDPAGLEANKWVHIIGTYDGSETKIYFNGVLAGSSTNQPDGQNRSITGNLKSTNQERRIGAGSGGGYYTDGTADEVRIYNRALSATEVSTLYNRSSKIRTIQSSQRNLVPNGLVGYWSFDGSDISGTSAYDRSGNNNTGTLTNGPTVAIGKMGQAMNFDGSDDYVDCGSGASLNLNTSFTYTAWIKPQNVTGDKMIISKGTTGQWYVYFSLNGNKLYVATYDDSTVATLDGLTVLSASGWSHVVVSYDGSSLKLYVNGVLDNSTSSLINPSTGGTQFTYIGRPTYTSGSYFNGLIDDTRIYNRALTTSEINQLYKAGEAKLQATQNSKLTNGLVGLWSFDGPDISGTTAYDRSGNANNGTLTNGPTVAIGKMGQAVNLDGSNDYINTSATGLDFSTGDFSISFWNKTNGSITSIAEALSTPDESIRVSYNNACVSDQPKGLAVVAGGQIGCTSNAIGTYTDGNWHLGTIVRTSGTVTFYHDGVSILSFASSGNVNANSFQLGKYAGAALNHFNGSLDDTRIYNRALSTGEIQMLYNMGR